MMITHTVTLEPERELLLVIRIIKVNVGHLPDQVMTIDQQPHYLYRYLSRKRHQRAGQPVWQAAAQRAVAQLAVASSRIVQGEQPLYQPVD